MSAVLSNLGLELRDDPVVVPGSRVEQVCEPESVLQVSEIVGMAAAEKAGLLILGGRTRLSLANSAGSLRLGLSLTSLAGVDEFEPDEGVLHAKAGTSIAAIRETARKEGWELPLDSPGAATTVGGTISSAVSGPRAQAFGSVPDAILGLDVVGGEGVASKCGGRVVKNVTGYDMAKLYCGSYGSLAVVTGAWLRLRPLPATAEAYRAEVPNDSDSFEAIRSFSRLTSIRALIWSELPGESTASVLIELGGSSGGVAHDKQVLSSKLALEAVETSEVDRARDARAEAGSDAEPIALRVRVLGSRTDAMRRELLAAGFRVSIDPGLGVICGRGSAETSGPLVLLRASAEEAGGFATFEQLPGAWRNEVDVFGSLGGADALVATLKSKFDPAGILNPGRFVAEAREGLVS